MKLHVIGSGGPRPTAENYGCGCVLEVGDEFIMLDCGPGTTYKLSKMNLSPTQVNTLLITHHHTDHIVDFPCFSLLRFDLDNGDLPPLEVYGPAPTKEFVDDLIGDRGVFIPDIISRRKHPVAQHNYLKRGGELPRPTVKARGHNIESGSVIETKKWKATAILVPHLEPYITSLAYRIDTEEGNILYLGDSGICGDLVEEAKGVDTLITGILLWNTRLDPRDSHHNVSADLPDIIELCNDAQISKVIGIHGTTSTDNTLEALIKECKRSGMSFSSQLICPEEMTTIDINE